MLGKAAPPGPFKAASDVGTALLPYVNRVTGTAQDLHSGGNDKLFIIVISKRIARSLRAAPSNARDKIICVETILPSSV